MKENKLKIIISFMSLALAGLIAVQIYWIKNAIELESKLFDFNVTKALNSVVKDISQSESAEYVVHALMEPDQDAIVTGKRDTLNEQNYFFKGSGKNNSRYKYNTGNSNFDINLQSTVENDSSILIIEYNSYDDDSTLISTQKKFISTTQLDSIKYKKSIFVNNVVNNLILMRNTTDIENRIKEDELFDYITINLNNNGVSTDFIFAIESEERDSLLFNNNEEQVKELLNNSYSAQLFPEDLFNKPDRLLVYFPGRTKYLLQSASLVLILSGILILTIIFLYYKTVRILIKQKKLADIKSDLINNVTHEFKTPIATISLASEALQENEIINDKKFIEKYALMIREESGRLKRMVDSLLSTAFLENGGFELRKSKINIHLIIDEIIEKKKLRLDLDKDDIQTNFIAEKILIMGDVLHITNLLDNLIDNAVKYSFETVNVIVETENNAGGIIIKIKDSGIGIEKKHLKKIFNTFYRVQKGDVQDTRGYGIGLGYVKKLAEAHKGYIKVNSKPGIGSEFIVFLPHE